MWIVLTEEEFNEGYVSYSKHREVSSRLRVLEKAIKEHVSPEEAEKIQRRAKEIAAEEDRKHQRYIDSL